MRTTLSYIGSQQLNNASAATPGGTQDVVTGLPISTGTNSGDFIELTAAQAKALSKTSVGTLYEGVFQRVKLSSTASNPALGEALVWNDTNDTTDPYPVTNNPAAGAPSLYEYAGTVIDPSTTPGQYCWIQINGKASVRLTTAGAAGNAVLYPTTAPGQYTATGTTVTVAAVGEQIAAASGNVALALITRQQTKY